MPARLYAVDGVPEIHPVGDDRPLRAAGRAGCVKDGRNIIQCGGDWFVQGGAVQSEVLEHRPQRADSGDVAEFGKLFGAFVEFQVVDQQCGRAVGQNRTQFRVRQAPVQWYEDRADATAGKLDFKCIGGVGGQHRDAIAGFYSELRSERARQSGNPSIIGGIGVGSFGCQVNGGKRLRLPHGVMRNAVIIRN